MKKVLTIIFLFVSVIGFSQVKKDSIPPVTPSHTLTLTDQQWEVVFSMLRQNGKMTGLEIENTIEFMSKNMQPIKSPKKNN